MNHSFVVAVDTKHMSTLQHIYNTSLSLPVYQFIMHHGLCMFTRAREFAERTFPPTCAALDGSDGGGGGGGGARRRAGPGDARRRRRLLLVFLRAALLYGAHVAVAPHAEAVGDGQVQGIDRLRLHLAEHRLAHGLDLPVHLHLAHLRGREGMGWGGGGGGRTDGKEIKAPTGGIRARARGSAEVKNEDAQAHAVVVQWKRDVYHRGTNHGSICLLQDSIHREISLIKTSAGRGFMEEYA